MNRIFEYWTVDPTQAKTTPPPEGRIATLQPDWVAPLLGEKLLAQSDLPKKARHKISFWLREDGTEEITAYVLHGTYVVQWTSERAVTPED